MPLGFREDRRRRRRRARLAVVRWLLVGAAVVVLGAYAFQTGERVAQRNAAGREQQIVAFRAKIEGLESQLQAQQAELAAARAAAEEWRQRYERDVLAGEARELLPMLQARLEAGVEPQRLRWLLSQIGTRRDCESRSEVRRVPVQTPIARGARTATALAGGTLGVLLDGNSAKNEKGDPEPWFDPLRPVTLRITLRNGKAIDSEGVLPLQHSIVDGDREYRLSVAAGPRGSANVSLERCRFP